ncbi:MAG: hypothetical protein FWH23_01510 [Bacteroidales bacterium]|nr:hypothetical protein [Bacteroidales bacterium]MCL2133170.1 hypothetical protein [Bacteroidales bacterium]
METTHTQSGKAVKGITIALSVVLLAVIAIFVYVWLDRSKLIDELTTDKQGLTLNLEQLRAEYDDLQTTNDTINLRLIEEREKVDLLIERLKTTEATNRAKIRQYEQELGLLRDVMRSYVRQIDSLNTLNQALRAETIRARNDAAETDKKYETLVKHTDELTQKVEKGAVVRIRDIKVVAITSKAKATDKAKSVAKIKTCFMFVENSIAERGFRNVYIRVKGPDNILLAQGQHFFTVDNEQLIYSDMREIDYQGEDLEVCVFYGGANEKFIKGVYTVDIYSGGDLVGTGQLLLK